MKLIQNYRRYHNRQGLVNDEHPWRDEYYIEIQGNSREDALILTEYAYGLMVGIRHPRNQLEFHGWRDHEGGYSALATMVVGRSHNEFQLRQKGDTDCIAMKFPEEPVRGQTKIIPEITTEFNGRALAVSPKGDLHLRPSGEIIIQNETLTQLVRRIISRG